jgi:nucleoid DNA-binding protein
MASRKFGENIETIRGKPVMTVKKTTTSKATKPSVVEGGVIASASPEATRVPAPGIRPAPVSVPPISVVGKDASDGEAEAPPVLKKPDLFDRVVTASGAKKRDVKPIVEAALAVIGDALSAGEELNLPPLGKVKINRQRKDKSGDMLIVKIKRNSGPSQDKEPLAEDGEDD